jgi:hypothetical protein
MKRWMLTVLSSSLITAISLAQPGSYSPFPGEPCSCPETEDPVSDDYAANQRRKRRAWARRWGWRALLHGLRGVSLSRNTTCITRPAEGSIQLGTSGGNALLGDRGIALTSGYPWGVFPGGMYISMRTQREGQTQTFVWGRQEGAPSLRFSQAWRARVASTSAKSGMSKGGILTCASS